MKVRGFHGLPNEDKVPVLRFPDNNEIPYVSGTMSFVSVPDKIYWELIGENWTSVSFRFEEELIWVQKANLPYWVWVWCDKFLAKERYNTRRRNNGR